MKNLFLMILLLFLSLNLNAQDNSKQLLKSLQNKFETIKDLTADILQKSGGKDILSGKLSYKKENKFHFDLKNNLIVSDGLTIWNYNKKDKKLIINNIDETDPSLFSFKSIIYDYPSQCTISSEKEGEVLVFVPKENSELNFSKAKLWINRDNLIDTIIIINKDAVDIEINFINYTLNQNLTDTKFKFSPPEGSAIIDLR